MLTTSFSCVPNMDTNTILRAEVARQGHRYISSLLLSSMYILHDLTIYMGPHVIVSAPPGWKPTLQWTPFITVSVRLSLFGSSTFSLQCNRHEFQSSMSLFSSVSCPAGRHLQFQRQFVPRRCQAPVLAAMLVTTMRKLDISPTEGHLATFILPQRPVHTSELIQFIQACHLLLL